MKRQIEIILVVEPVMEVKIKSAESLENVILLMNV